MKALSVCYSVRQDLSRAPSCSEGSENDDRRVERARGGLRASLLSHLHLDTIRLVLQQQSTLILGFSLLLLEYTFPTTSRSRTFAPNKHTPVIAQEAQPDV